MKKQKKLIVGNWKMNPISLEEARKLSGAVKRGVQGLKKTSVVLCPPFVYIPSLSALKAPLYLGAQNISYEEKGSFTGEVSFSQLPQFGVRFVILGHSERRKMGESDELINKKIKSVISCGMVAILCVGEGVRDNNGDYYNFIKGQIVSALRDIPKKSLNNLVVAYEPIWAIGSTTAMSPRDLHEMSIFIRKILKETVGDVSSEIAILYGGAVDIVNAEQLVRDGNVSGLLIGRQSLVAKDFVEIIKTIDRI